MVATAGTGLGPPVGGEADHEGGVRAVTGTSAARVPASRGLLKIGILALQGDFALHESALAIAGAAPRLVRVPGEMAGLHGLVLPGGESTALLRLMGPLGMEEALCAFHRGGGVLFGTCAGLILLAKTVTHPGQPSLGLLDVTVERNGYGRQADSFVGTGRIGLAGEEEADLEMVFIRAPRIRAAGPEVRVVATHAGEPVLVEQGPVLAATFHPEMSVQPAGGGPVHRRFLAMCRAAGR